MVMLCEKILHFNQSTAKSPMSGQPFSFWLLVDVDQWIRGEGINAPLRRAASIPPAAQFEGANQGSLMPLSDG